MAKTQLNDKKVQQLARLANLRLTDDELAQIKPQLEETLSVVKKLQALDTTKITATPQVTGLFNVYRSDQIDSTRILSQTDALINASHTHKGFFVVPQVIDHET